jgi:hypothetical protein
MGYVLASSQECYALLPQLTQLVRNILQNVLFVLGDPQHPEKETWKEKVLANLKQKSKLNFLIIHCFYRYLFGCYSGPDTGEQVINKIFPW